jgi:hypothetical protein
MYTKVFGYPVETDVRVFLKTQRGQKVKGLEMVPRLVKENNILGWRLLLMDGAVVVVLLAEA